MKSVTDLEHHLELWDGDRKPGLVLLAPNPLAIASINAAAFLVNPVYNVATITYRLRSVPDELQGRVNSVARVLALGAVPVGAAAGGVILQAAGTTAMVWARGRRALAAWAAARRF